MTPEQAHITVDNALRQMSLPRDQHNALTEAMNALAVLVNADTEETTNKRVEDEIARREALESEEREREEEIKV